MTLRIGAGAAQSVPVLPADIQDRGYLVIRIATIHNPASQSFVLRAVLAVGPDSAEVGRVAPYPPTRPGLFRMRLPDSARPMTSKYAKQLRLVLGLRSATPERPLGDVSVEVDSIGWAKPSH